MKGITVAENYVMTINVNGGCGHEFPVIWDHGMPLEQIAFPTSAELPLVCPKCGPQGEMNVTLNSIPGG
jgi:hypothetical protein